VFCGIALRCWVCESERMNRTFEACRSECGKRVHAAEQEGALCGQTPGSRGSFFQVDATITCLACLRAITEATKPAEEVGCDFEAPEHEQCPMCGGEAFAGGSLGKLTHYNCRQCGWWFHKECV